MTEVAPRTAAAPPAFGQGGSGSTSGRMDVCNNYPVIPFKCTAAIATDRCSVPARVRSELGREAQKLTRSAPGRHTICFILGPDQTSTSLRKFQAIGQKNSHMPPKENQQKSPQCSLSHCPTQKVEWKKQHPAGWWPGSAECPSASPSRYR